MGKYYDRIAIPMGIDTENNDTVTLNFSAVDAVTGANGYQIYTHSSDKITTHIISNARKIYSENELEIYRISCGRSPDCEVTNYTMLFDRLKEIENEAEERQRFIYENGTRFTWYQRDADTKKFSQKLYFIDAVLSIDDIAAESKALELLGWLSNICYRYGIYFVLTHPPVFAYAGTNYLHNFIGRVYCARCTGDSKYVLSTAAHEYIDDAPLDSIIIHQGFSNDYKICKTGEYLY